MGVRDGKALVEGTDVLIGSLANMHTSVINMIKFTGCSIVEALESASLHPAQVLNWLKLGGRWSIML